MHTLWKTPGKCLVFSWKTPGISTLSMCKNPGKQCNLCKYPTFTFYNCALQWWYVMNYINAVWWTVRQAVLMLMSCWVHYGSVCIPSNKSSARSSWQLMWAHRRLRSHHCVTRYDQRYSVRYTFFTRGRMTSFAWSQVTLAWKVDSTLHLIAMSCYDVMIIDFTSLGDRDKP